MATDINKDTAQLSFYGGTGDVTGANFHFKTSVGTVVVDCGLIQGGAQCDARNWEDFPFDPKEVDVVFITHSHQDHIGRLPKLVKDGFKGKIYSTQPTRELSEVMLRDSMSIMIDDAKRQGREPIYEAEDIAATMHLWKGVPYHNKTELFPGWTFEFKDAGHVLGSVMIQITHNDKTILFTGDLGNSPNVLLHDIEKVSNIDYLVMESVYGDRNHEHVEDRTFLLERAIEDIVHRKGTLVIPVFSLERTQEILFEINSFVEHERVPKVDMYLDSPLAIEVTEIYKRSKEFFNEGARKIIASGDDIFQFPQLFFTKSVEESKAINDAHVPKVILAGSGMMNGGRVIHHALRYLPDEKNMILFVGYQAAGTLGRVLQDGARKVTIYGNEVPVKAEIRTISGYSGHAGGDELVAFVEGIKDSVKKVFCVMGEPKAAMFLSQRLRDYLGIMASAPDEGDSVELDFS